MINTRHLEILFYDQDLAYLIIYTYLEFICIHILYFISILLYLNKFALCKSQILVH